VSATKCENLSLGMFINVRERSQNKNMIDCNLDETIGMWKPDRMMNIFKKENYIVFVVVVFNKLSKPREKISK